MLISLFASVLFAATAQPEAGRSGPRWIAPTQPTPAGPEPRWVWVATPGKAAPTARNAPEGAVWLGKTFKVADLATVRSATLALAADNGATAWINGVKAMESRDWSTPVFAQVSLLAGLNVLHIEARNAPGAAKQPEDEVNPGGVIARLAITREDGATEWVRTDATWTGAPGTLAEARAAEREIRGINAIDLGPASAPPWGLKLSAFEPPPPCPIFRRSFTMNQPPASGTVRIIGLGHYELRCNGHTVGDTLINQSWSQYNKTLYSQEFDLAPHLTRGENVLAVVLGNSFWRVEAANDSGRFTKTDAMPDFSNGWPHLVWMDARINAAAGSGDSGSPGPRTDADAAIAQHEVRIVSDGAWKWSRGPLTSSNIYAGEDYDARAEPLGWDKPGFDDSSWASAEIASTPEGKPTKLDGPAIKAYEVFAATEIKEPEPGVFTYIFPQNCSALLRYTLEGGAAGSRVRFKPCEYMDPAGKVKFTYTWGTGKDIWQDYTKRGAGSESHQTLFCYDGAQFVEVTGAVPIGKPNPNGLPVLKSLELVHVRAACESVGAFDSSSKMHNASHTLIDWAIKSNMSHFPTDCPHREKACWIEQDWHMARSLSYRYDIRAWFEKTLRDIRDAQLEDGHIPTNSPNYLVGVPPHGFWNNAPEWGIAGVLVPWHIYEWYGDRRVLEDNYASAKKYIDYLASTAKDGAITSNLGDWYDYGHGKGNGPSQWTPNEVSATAIWAYGAATLSNMAKALGRADDAAKYLAMREQIARDFQRRFYDPATHTVKNNGSCQAANAAALCIGLIPEPDRAAALQAIIDDLEKRNWQQTPGEVLQVFLIRALAENGRGDILHRIYNRDEIGSYGHMVKTGLTTLPESWDARRGTGDSLNHFMLGHLVEWHFAYVCGIRQQAGSVGWNKVLIAPQPPPRSDVSPNALRRAEATFNSPRGRIASAWAIENGKFTLRCEIPEGVEAEAVMSDGTRRKLEAGATVMTAPAR